MILDRRPQMLLGGTVNRQWIINQLMWPTGPDWIDVTDPSHKGAVFYKGTCWTIAHSEVLEQTAERLLRQRTLDETAIETAVRDVRRELEDVNQQLAADDARDVAEDNAADFYYRLGRFLR